MTPALVRRVGPRVRPDASRVVNLLFLPGQEAMAGGASRSAEVVARVAALDDATVATALAHVMATYASRTVDLPGLLDHRFALVAHRVPDEAAVSRDRRRLIGALFSQEYAVEGAALCNPSMVPYDDGSGRPGTGFLMSVRLIGEGHRSSIGLRTGRVLDDDIAVDPPIGPVVPGESTPTWDDRDALLASCRAAGVDPEDVALLASALPTRVDAASLEAALRILHAQSLTRANESDSAALVRAAADESYRRTFPPTTRLDQRVMMPTSAAEAHGLEDLRLVRFHGADGATDLRGTYTAYDGVGLRSTLLTTSDFTSVHVRPMTGPAAANKGLALFPAPVGGSLLALSRWTRESSTLAMSDDGTHWRTGPEIHAPRRVWEAVQTGNCGSPLLTDAGWLVLTHGVGPLREYAIGAVLLDAHDPGRVLGSVTEPVMTPAADERDGYVPNVLYSCGAMLDGDRVVLPYGCSDASVAFALIDLRALLDRLT